MSREYDGYLKPYLAYMQAAYENGKPTIEIARVLYEDFGVRSPYGFSAWSSYSYGGTPWLPLNGVIRNALRVKTTKKRTSARISKLDFVEGLSSGG
jgi:hypothetical protein